MSKNQDPEAADTVQTTDDQAVDPAAICSPVASVRKTPACAPPLGESGEEYYCKRDDFTRYIADQVNPAREAAGLQLLCWRTAEECYRILNDFAKQWGCNPIPENND